MPKRILLVEDDENTIVALSDILELMLDQEVIVARDGLQAIRMADTHLPDLILMDLNLPKLNGLEATRSLRSDQKFANTPVLAITAHSMVGDRERALEAGCNDYYSKPVDVDSFVEFLRPYLHDKGDNQ